MTFYTIKEAAKQLEMTPESVRYYLKGNTKYKARLEFNTHFFKYGNTYLLNAEGLEKIKEIRSIINRK